MTSQRRRQGSGKEGDADRREARGETVKLEVRSGKRKEGQGNTVDCNRTSREESR